MGLKITVDLVALRAALAGGAASVDLVLEGDTVVAVAGPPEEPPPVPSPIEALPAEVLLGWYAPGGVSTTAGGCSAWTDRSSHGAHLMQASAGRRPAVGQHALGQGLAVRGDGAGAYVDLYALSLTLQGDGIHFTSGDCTTVANAIGPAVDTLLAA